MDQSKSTAEAQPPPYSYPDYGQKNAGGQDNYGQNTFGHPQDSVGIGPGNIAVVCPAGQYGNNDQGSSEDQPPPPPWYSCGMEDANCFDDKAIRRGFIKKVYLTLMIQLLITIGIMCAFLYWETLREWSRRTYWLPYTMMGVVLVLSIALSCSGHLRRQVPHNFLALGLFTLAEGVLLGSVSAYFEVEAVMWAVGATALVCLALSLFSLQSRWDFTKCNTILWVFLWVAISYGLLYAIMPNQYLESMLACAGAFSFSIYLVTDTQLILNGKHKYAISSEEYIFATLNLYLDVISVYTLLLILFGLRN
ncbi:protein lifeguard 1 [Esox lucius]|uniref:Protein lifeguard 1-like n=1 Tax=Esox lucius TaxID=8010 RepID=A0A3P8ZDT8_ESOLU|nr:protein lifeguard 1 [Esox lucius]XP_019910492.1 protein lifeguard 1 [Esox lucius]